PRHVQRELPRRVGEVVDGPAGPLHGLELADEDAVDALLDRLAAGQVGERGEALCHLELSDPPAPHPDEAILTRQLVVGEGPLHSADYSTSGARVPGRPLHTGMPARVVEGAEAHPPLAVEPGELLLL